MTTTDEIMQLFLERGTSAYFGEGVSVAEHGLQAAHFARLAGAPAALIIAALLHDIGHLLTAVADDPDDWVEDACHEKSGARWLGSRFPAEVTEPVRLHVPAKRFLCATDPRYVALLSPASLVTLKLQGGPMSVLEVTEFKAAAFYQQAVAVRRWDDRAKVVGLATPDFADYVPEIQTLSMRRA